MFVDVNVMFECFVWFGDYFVIVEWMWIIDESEMVYE